MKIVKANGRLRGKQPKLKPNQAKYLLELHDLVPTLKPNSPNSSASADPPSTAPSSGCGLGPRNPSDPSHTLRIRRRRGRA